MAPDEHTPTLLTFGHGTLDAAGLAGLLRDARIERVVDVRRYPGSRTNHAATRPALESLTTELEIDYRWDERLGGRRHLSKDELDQSPDSWWRVTQFRAYAAWTRTEQFRAGLTDLLLDIPEQRTAIMCSESVWWRCHRRIVADVVLGEHQVPVQHLMHDGRQSDHELSAGARLLPEVRHGGRDGGGRGLVWDADST